MSGHVRGAGAVAVTSLRRLVRDRSAVFFLVILPVVIIVVLGSSVSSTQQFRVGVVDGDGSAHAERLVATLTGDAALDVRAVADAEAAGTGLRRGELDVAVLVPNDLHARVEAGEVAEVSVLAEQTSQVQRAASTAVTGAVERHGSFVVVARLRQEATGGDLASQVGATAALAEREPPLEVVRTVVDAESNILPGGFNYSVPTMLVLFVFITAVTGSGAIIESRGLGIHDRALAGPLTAGTLVAGETLSLLLVSLVQAGLIVGVGTFAFGVEWGDLPAAALLVGLWALVGTGAGVLAGTVFRTPEQSTSIGITVGMVAGMLGGCMWPLEIVPDTLRTIGHLTPHAWAIDGWIEVLSRGGGVADIATELAVLAGFAALLLGAAIIRLRARLAA